MTRRDGGGIPCPVPEEAETQHDVHEASQPAHADVLVEPADELAPDEPRTPLWLTMLGGALFLLMAIVWLVARPSDRASTELTPAMSASASVAAAPAQPPNVLPPQAAPPATPPAPSPGPTLAPIFRELPKPAGKPTKATKGGKP